LVAITAGTLAWHFEQPTVASLSSVLGPILYVGILSSALTFTLFTYAVRHTSPSEVAVIVSTECLFAAAAGAIVLGERLMLLSWIGAALILASILLVQLAPRPDPH
jgi:drug/metabolite transporter (DMT)-like permease